MAGRPERDDLTTRTHRALSNVNRVRIMKLLEAGPRDVRSMAEATNLHPNTVRAHLDVLVGGDLVVRERGSPTGRGRPSSQFALAPPHRPRGRREHEALVAVLAAALESVAEEPAAAAEEAGRPLGRALVAPGSPASALAAVEQVVAVLEEVGFEPELIVDSPGETARVLLHRCPFDDLAQRYGDIVCSVHLGMVRGALEELGASVHAELGPAVQPTVCVTDLSFRSRD